MTVTIVSHYDMEKRDDLLTNEFLVGKFDWSNYFVFSLMLVISTAIGLFFWWRGQKNTEEFLMAGRSMGVFPVSLSLIASFMSAITLLGVPAEIYVTGTQYIVIIFTFPFVMFITAHIFLPIFYALQPTTVFEYFQLRFESRAIRLQCASLFTLQMCLYMAIVVYTPALAISQITGFNVDAACAIIFAVCVFYTTIGGMKAVMWTDVFQALVMFGSFIAIIWKGSNDAGGASKVFDANYQSGRVQLFGADDVDVRARHTVWSLFIGGFFMWLSIYGINQTQVQRYLTCSDLSVARSALWWQVPGIGALLLICSYGGMTVYAYFRDCDPIKTHQVTTKDQLLPFFVMQVMGDIPLVPGLFVAGVFSGALSTVSSGLNSLAAVWLKDFVIPWRTKPLTSRSEVLLTKLLALVFGAVGYTLVFAVKYVPGVLEAAYGIFGIVGGPVLGAFSLGMFFPFANYIGALSGTIVSLILTMWIGFGQTVSQQMGTYGSTGNWSPKMPTSVENCTAAFINAIPPPAVVTHTDSASSFTHLAVYEVSYMWFPLIAAATCMIVGIVASLLSGMSDHRYVRRDCICLLVPGLFKYAPRVIRDRVVKYWDEIGANLLKNESTAEVKYWHEIGADASDEMQSNGATGDQISEGHRSGCVG
eukprot:GEMP01033771.1.p1 GENE.GEMP01033771.1~~GEMP01033771.1.p1  ORF type:complete len:654 (+),score=118.16 GEMP01033771.1:25-1962(+)